MHSRVAIIVREVGRQVQPSLRQRGRKITFFAISIHAARLPSSSSLHPATAS